MAPRPKARVRYCAYGLRRDAPESHRWERFYAQTIIGDAVYFTEHFTSREDVRDFLLRFADMVDGPYEAVEIRKVIFFKPKY
jgi:hypothetical protein